ncbi:hypothetical protein PG993_008593 [Apiospora rasikravindrae]|uniref:Rhodopsin domain-containing protein n=1 Tax=Apiospora rasikravindrae TaxID=990691 RepID=A0ABR1T0S6_9PEZI
MSAPNIEDLIPPPVDVNDAHKVHSIANACIALGVLGALAVGVRVGVRVGHGNFGADDYAIIVALIFYIGWTAFAAYSNLHAGIGKPLWEITVGEFSLYWQSILAATFLYPAMSGSIRISILLFYRRIFSPEQGLKRVLWILIALQLGYVVAFSITPAFICDPLWKIKYPLEILSSCDLLFYNANLTSVYVISIAFDLTLAILPMFFLSKLQMTRTRRYRAALIFVVGASACVPAVYKFAIATKEWKNPSMGPLEWYNYQMAFFVPVQLASYGTTYWIPCQVEPCAALLGTSLPAFRQLYHRLRGSEGTRGSKASGSVGSSGNKSSNPMLNRRRTQQQDYITVTSEVELQDQHRASGVPDAPWQASVQAGNGR